MTMTITNFTKLALDTAIQADKKTNNDNLAYWKQSGEEFDTFHDLLGKKMAKSGQRWDLEKSRIVYSWLERTQSFGPGLFQTYAKTNTIVMNEKDLKKTLLERCKIFSDSMWHDCISLEMSITEGQIIDYSDPRDKECEDGGRAIQMAILGAYDFVRDLELSQ